MRNSILTTKRIIEFVFFAVVFSVSSKVFANPCSTKSGAVVTYNQNINFDSNQNFAGYETGVIPASAPGSFNVGGLCNPKKNVFWSSIVGEGMNDMGDGWYSVPGGAANYLQVKTSVAVFNARNESTAFYPVPFTDINNHCSEASGGVCGGSATTGSKIKVNLRIVKPFVGFESIDEPVAFISGNNNTGESAREVMVQVILHANITVPQSCEIDGGTVVTIDFGNIGASNFSKAGAGNIPLGIKPKEHTIGIQCKNIDAQAMLSLRLESDNTSGNIMVSDNKDVGFIVAGKDKSPLTPNDVNSKLEFQLDDNFSAKVPIVAWPVSVTGNSPEEGRFTSEGYLRVDFD